MSDEEKSKRGARSRRRGAAGELELAHILNEKFDLNVRRGYVFHHESDLVGLDGIHVECKRVNKLNIHAAMEQAKTEAIKRNDGKPAVFFRRDRGEWLVCIQLATFVELYKAWRDKK